MPVEYLHADSSTVLECLYVAGTTVFYCDRIGTQQTPSWSRDVTLLAGRLGNSVVIIRFCCWMGDHNGDGHDDDDDGDGGYYDYSGDVRQDVVKILLQRGANVNSKDKDNITALMEASIMDHRDVVKHLLKVCCCMHANLSLIHI